MNDSNAFLPSASLETLRQRAHLLSVVRRHFEAEGYLEVETPILSHDTVVDAWLEPFSTRDRTGSTKAEMFLQTSPEFGMKRLLAAGATAIYQISRAFRQGERGSFHNPEFTMIEWYRAGDTYHDQMAFTERLVTAVLDAGRRVAGTEIGAKQPFERLSYDDAFDRHCGERVLLRTASELAALAARLSVAAPQTLREDDTDGWLNLLLSARVEPCLGKGRGQFLYDFPTSQAALSRIRGGNPSVAERFELYIDGIELCNGYQELTDPAELQQRMKQQQAIRTVEGLRELPEENRLLEAMCHGLPQCAGVALGFDRLVMLALGKRSLDEVQAFPWERA